MAQGGKCLLRLGNLVTVSGEYGSGPSGRTYKIRGGFISNGIDCHFDHLDHFLEIHLTFQDVLPSQQEQEL